MTKICIFIQTLNRLRRNSGWGNNANSGKQVLEKNGRHLNNGGLLTKLQKTKDDGVGLILLGL